MGLLWFVASATVVIRQDDGSETVAPTGSAECCDAVTTMIGGSLCSTDAVAPGSLLPGAGPDCGLEERSHARTLKQSYAVLGTGLNAS
jgi:hypothetical protein